MAEPTEHQDEADTAPFGSPTPNMDDPVGSPSIETEPGLVAAKEKYAQYLPNPDSVRFLESCSLQAMNIRSVNTCFATTALGKGKNRAIDTAVAEFLAACDKLDDGKKKLVDRIAVEWGLSVTLAAKLSEKCLIRLVAGAYLLASQ